MNLRGTLENRSGRVIALFRAMVALVFLVALLMEPIAGEQTLLASQLVLGGYAVISLGAILIAWRSWWYDQQFAPVLLVIDVVVFVTAVFVSEAAGTDFTSPFLAMFALAILSATLRWDWRVAALTGVAATLLFLAVGSALWFAGAALDPYRFSRRALYMLALLLVLLWFGIERRDPHVPPFELLGDDANGDPSRWRALAYAMAATGANRGALAWSEAEEPWFEVHQAGPAERRAERLAPSAMPHWDEALEEVRLFDLVRCRKLVRDGDNLPRARTLQRPDALASLCGIEEGLAIPVRCVSGSGLIVLGGLTGAGADFVTLGSILAREIGSALDRGAVLQLEREALLSRTRSAIARDLHDSVAQSLAGACFRLEALRRSITPDSPVAAEIGAIREALRGEQGHVRRLIDTLRGPGPAPQIRALEPDLRSTGEDAGVHWNVAVSVDAAPDIVVPNWFSHEVQQLVREAVANAARHGLARSVRLAVQRDGGQLHLAITDDGCGFDLAAQDRQPWSIRERVAALGGRLAVDSGSTGTRLAIVLPAGATGAHA